MCLQCVHVYNVAYYLIMSCITESYKIKIWITYGKCRLPNVSYKYNFLLTHYILWRKGMHMENTIHHTLKPWHGFLFCGNSASLNILIHECSIYLKYLKDTTCSMFVDPNGFFFNENFIHLKKIHKRLQLINNIYTFVLTWKTSQTCQ
jgi:hypothetical protein